jgi:hypothetical protein
MNIRCGELDEEGSPLAWPWLVTPPSTGAEDSIILSISAQFASLYRQAQSMTLPVSASPSGRHLVSSGADNVNATKQIVIPTPSGKATALLGLRNRSKLRKSLTVEVESEESEVR